MLFLDANFFVFAVGDMTKKGESARQLQREIIIGKKQAVTSVAVLDEVMWALIKNKKKHLVRRVVEDIYAFPNLEIKPVTVSTPIRVLDIMDMYNLKPRDALHVAVMEECNLKTIVSDDADFDRVRTIKRIGFS